MRYITTRKNITTLWYKPFSSIETIGEGVVENDVDERDDEPFQHVESLHRIPRVAFLLVLFGACATRADRARGLKLDAKREDFLHKVGTRGAS
ncbi:hypothetical protein MTR_2g040920 [Medicago truncatula]|uniref:Uncharacterized protein n=1 Tax=Medicago truncatula TaxID=3880 RepID=A0A072V645_MEDTR|nr:hypothetical protein MTR_2g040920 [Medicago truncatula]